MSSTTFVAPGAPVPRTRMQRVLGGAGDLALAIALVLALPLALGLVVAVIELAVGAIR